jgi:hypothetical protein
MLRWAIRLTAITVLAATPARAQYAKLLSDDGAADDRFGCAVALDSGVAIVGACGDDDAGLTAGAVYLFDVATGAQVAKLLASDAEPVDEFGCAVAADGGVALIGALFEDNENGIEAGSAYLFDLASHRQLAKLVADDGAEFDFFGESVDIDGNTAVVGASGAGTAGAAYLFAVSSGAQLAKLTPDDGGIGDGFGRAVAIADGLVVVGAYANEGGGSAYVFEVTTGRLVAKLKPDEWTAYFGCSVGLDDGTAIVGRCWYPSHKRAYLFDAATGEQLAVLDAIDGHAEGFGCAVGISDGVAIVGARYDDDKAPDSGTAYLFDVASGRQLTKLVAADGQLEDECGAAVAVGGGVAISSSPYDDDNGNDAGAAYLFRFWPCIADFDDNGALDTRDLIAFLRAWVRAYRSADWDGDGTVDGRDFAAYLDDWLMGCE